MVELANGLCAEGLRTDLVVARDDGPWRRLLSRRVRLVTMSWRGAPIGLVKLVRYLHRERPDIMLANGRSSIILALVARRVVPGLAVISRIPSNLKADSINASLKNQLMKAVEARLLPHSDAIVTNSDGSSEDLIRSVPRAAPRVRTIHNPVVWPGLAAEAAEPLQHPWFHDGGAPIILSVGRLVPHKDHATLIRAFVAIAKERAHRLVVLGEGPERRNLHKLALELKIAHRVDFPGFHSNPFAFMAKSRLFVLSSTFEGMPNVLIQAMACGTPVVSTDCPSGPREVLEDGKWGELVPVGDAEKLAEAMKSCLDSPQAPEKLIARAHTFSAAASVQAYLRLMAQIAQGDITHRPARRDTTVQG